MIQAQETAVPLRDQPLAQLLSPQAEAKAFWRMRVRTFWRSVRQNLETSRLRVSLVVFLSLFFWVGLFLLFSGGFRFLSTSIAHPTTHAQTVQAIYNVFFMSLMMMLVLSAGIILYGGLYCTPEAAFLLTTPSRPERIVLHKFHEAIAFSSWGFLLLGSPMLVAYGVESGAPWYYYALLLPFMLAFIYIPGSIGAICCLLIVHRVPRLRWPSVFVLAVLAATAGVFICWSVVGGTENNLLTPMWFQEMLSRLKFSEHRLLPSWWLSSGLLEAARGKQPGLDYEPWAESMLFLTLLVSNALFFHMLAVWTAVRVYRVSYSEYLGDRPARRPWRTFWLDTAIQRWTPFLSQPVRLLLVKDLRLFRRDPVQWLQFLIFFGLLALYFVNIRHFSYDVEVSEWVNMISFLNLAVVGLILATFTTRFIFPMISLEGRRFWILGLLPVDRDAILWGKFLFATAGSAIPCTVLIFLSDVMLRISPLVIVVHQVTCLILCLGLSGIAVGLGAKMPNLREQSPSKIAAGFGGTLNLVLSAFYIVAIVLLTALPCHFYLAASQRNVDHPWLPLWCVLGTCAALLLGTVATLLPMRSGLRAFRELEF